MDEAYRFYVLMAASVFVLAAIIYVVAPPSARKTVFSVIAVSALISAGGMAFAKFGAGRDWPVALYYGLPAAATIFIPPVLFQMRPVRAAVYLALSFASAPAIHFSALFLLGWDNYMPFLKLGA